MYYIFADLKERGNIFEHGFGARKTFSEARKLMKDIHATRPEHCDIWAEKTTDDVEMYLNYRDGTEKRYYF